MSPLIWLSPGLGDDANSPAGRSQPTEDEMVEIRGERRGVGLYPA